MDFRQKENRLFTIAARGVYEDRLVAMRWEKNVSGEIYGESIYTKRAELMGSYQLPFQEN
jgi:outer membrane receptor for ferrienterochelin and colicins